MFFIVAGFSPSLSVSFLSIFLSFLFFLFPSFFNPPQPQPKKHLGSIRPLFSTDPHFTMGRVVYQFDAALLERQGRSTRSTDSPSLAQKTEQPPTPPQQQQRQQPQQHVPCDTSRQHPPAAAEDTPDDFHSSGSSPVFFDNMVDLPSETDDDEQPLARPPLGQTQPVPTAPSKLANVSGPALTTNFEGSDATGNADTAANGTNGANNTTADESDSNEPPANALTAAVATLHASGLHRQSPGTNHRRSILRRKRYISRRTSEVITAFAIFSPL